MGFDLENFKIELVPIKDLKFLEENANIMPSNVLHDLTEEMQEFGVVENIVVNRRNMTIVGGNHRVMVLEHKGETHAPVRFVELDEIKEAKLALALNKIRGKFDDDKLRDIFKKLDGSYDLTGFTDLEVSELLSVEEIADFAPPEIKELNSYVSFNFGEIRGEVPREVYENFETEILRIKKIMYPEEKADQVSLTRPLEMLVANSANTPTISIL